MTFVNETNKKTKYKYDNVYFTLAGHLKFESNNLGSGGGWHRDSPFTNQIKTIVYLTDVSSNNGPFEYLVGSHKRSFYAKLKNRWAIELNRMRFTNQEIDKITKCKQLMHDL